MTGYEVAKQLLVDPRIAKNTKDNWPAFREGKVPEDWELYTWVAMDNMQTRDAEEHDRLRKLVAQVFTSSSGGEVPTDHRGHRAPSPR